MLRTGKVGISGTSYIPSIPATNRTINNLKNILTSDKSETEKGIDLFLYGCKSQLFWDGNKRTSIIVANKYLISKGRGILSISENKIEEFGNKLAHYYETDETVEIKEFLYNNAIQGMEIQNQLSSTDSNTIILNKELYEINLEI